MSTPTAQITALIDARRLPEAESLARRACEQQPADATAWYLLAAVHSMQRNWDEVARCCQEVLRLEPAHTEARYNLGAALASLHRTAEAAAQFRRVLESSAGFTEAYAALAACLKDQADPAGALDVIRSGLRACGPVPALLAAQGDLLAEMDQAAAATESYQAALKLAPRDAAVHFRLGCAWQKLGRPDEAVRAFEAAVALQPGFTDAHGRLGSTLADLGRWPDAICCFNQVLALEPRHLSALVNLGAAQRASGCLKEAADTWRRALQLHPDSELARYFAAMAGDADTPGQSPVEYVRELFDSYAGRFEEHLVETLRYSTPALIASTLGELPAAARTGLDTLDLGCGTGLAGVAIRAMAGRLTGVDLSGRMIERAAARGVYDELHVAEIGDYLRADTELHDLIIAADVFVYVGDIRQILADGAARLKAGGLFLFSVERHAAAEPTAPDYVLRESGRYAHNPAYVRAAAAAAGLTGVRTVEHVVRLDGTTPLVGDLFVFRR